MTQMIDTQEKVEVREQISKGLFRSHGVYSRADAETICKANGKHFSTRPLRLRRIMQQQPPNPLKGEQ